MKWHTISDPKLEGRIYGEHDLSDLKTECDLQVPYPLPDQGKYDRHDLCPQCCGKAYKKAHRGELYCGPTTIVKF